MTRQELRDLLIDVAVLVSLMGAYVWAAFQMHGTTRDTPATAWDVFSAIALQFFVVFLAVNIGRKWERHRR